ncbi:MAG: calcium/sodium antiporter, partial [Candidatus Binatia bacterium]|nr:calcium/sodium antiporter [Candidatus Binatia bacterium]
METLTFVLLFFGLGSLLIGAELLVRGASRLAAASGISPLVIGLTVVAYGTSSPEIAVSVMSALAGQGDITVGNVVGSNIFNVLCILGLSALLVPLVVSRQLVWLEVPLMIGISCVLLLFALDGRLGRFEGMILCIGAVAYTAFSIHYGRKENSREEVSLAQTGVAKPGSTKSTLLTDCAAIVTGLALLVLGSHWFVQGAVAVARFLGVSDLIIGLTIVAAGTSLPEIATSLLASVRGERDIAVGNVVGSNI